MLVTYVGFTYVSVFRARYDTQNRDDPDTAEVAASQIRTLRRILRHRQDTRQIRTRLWTRMRNAWIRSRIRHTWKRSGMHPCCWRIAIPNRYLALA